ncbi:MAG: FTR1 family protein [Candidatus Omnitrophica bacterium]|nr:FTR1 family protein [Candidatus Omnitrophota bacterium]
MAQAFIIVLREGVEAFLIVAIVFSYLRKTAQQNLLGAVLWGIAASVLISGLLGYFLWMTQGANQPLWEGIFALATVILVGSLVIHMWKIGPQLKQSMERELTKATASKAYQASYFGVLLFTILMISREGMEMMLLLFQVRDPQMIAGIFGGVIAAALIAILWQQFGYLINLKHFFQITAVYFLLFMIQIAVQGFHEFTEAGIFPNSEMLHQASEPYSTEGIYGRWFSNLSFFGCALWIAAAWVTEKFSGSKLQKQ